MSTSTWKPCGRHETEEECEEFLEAFFYDSDGEPHDFGCHVTAGSETDLLPVQDNAENELIAGSLQGPQTNQSQSRDPC